MVGNDADFMVGGLKDSGGNRVNGYNGKVDEAQLYNRVLSPAEVTYLFNHPGSPVPEPASLATLSLGAIAVWRRRRKGVKE